MKRISILLVLISLLGIPVMVSAQNTSSVFKLEDIRKMVQISSPALSPDGTQTAVVISRADWAKDRYNREIVLIDVANRKSRVLTHDRKGLSQLKWSPDGSQLAFLAEDPKTKSSQVFVMPMNGGDALCVTDSKTGIDRYAWSPDGEQIAFIAQDTVPNPEAIKHHEDAFQVTDNNYLARAEVQPWHLWVVSAKGGKATQLTQGMWSLGTDQGSLSTIAWNNDGTEIVFTKYPDVWEGNAWHSVLEQVNVSTKKINPVTDLQGSSVPEYSSANNVLAFQRPRNGDQNNGFAVYVKNGDKVEDVTAPLAWNIDDFAWLPGDQNLLLKGFLGTRSVLWNQPIDGKASVLDLGDLNVSGALNVGKTGAFLFTASTPTLGTELYYMSSITSKPKQLTQYNQFLDSLNLAKSVSVEWTKDKFKEDGVLTYPVNFEKGKKYPLVLVIHGGPEYASTLQFSVLAQLLAAKGFLVFQPNYRGSTNLGDKYQHAIFRDTGKGPGEDVMAGLKKVESMGIVDKSNIGVTGWSYGGYMTSWLIGNYPDVWKAAMSGAALNDWVMDYTIAYYQKGDLYFFGGSPWVKKYWKIWREQSPIAYAAKAKAPTLIMGDAGDPNVPIVNSYQMYHALRDNGVTTEFYVYPVDTHFPHDIVRTTDVYRRWVDWMVKYLK
ncbi:MAG: S9 family peptidase [Bacteroidales bacterium]|nr:S9 family peptidase [Bacteroidales bacterium]